MKNIVIYCSASRLVETRFNDYATEIVSGLCAKGYGIVSGGTVVGTMGAVSDAAAGCGGHHKGVLPRFMEPLAYPGLSETVWTGTMSERKEQMRRDTVAAIALPGGIGTLDELIETLVLRKLGKYAGRVILFSPEGFYEPLLALLDHYVATNVLTPEDRALIECYNTPGALLESF